MNLDRRLFLAGGAAALAAAALPAGATPPPQHSGPPMPGWHRAKTGDVEATALLDGAMQGSNAFIQTVFPAPTQDRWRRCANAPSWWRAGCTSRSAPVC